MKVLAALSCLWLGTTFCADANERRVVCFYDSSAYLRSGNAEMQLQHLEMATNFCTHLVYGYAGVHPKSMDIMSLNVELDMFHYNHTTMLKAKHPHLKVFLSVGGDKDIDAEHPNKYIDLLTSEKHLQRNFIDGAVELLKTNNFDGLDLAFQLPRNKPRKVHSTLGTFWKQLKKKFTGDFIVDTEAELHKTQYTAFVQNLSNTFQRAGLALSMTVLPNVNASWYFDIPKLHNHFEFINLAAFDFLTPERNPEEADFTAPIQQPEGQDRLPHYNIDFQVNHWLARQCPSKKLNLGIATYGRAWKLSAGSGQEGIVPVVRETIGPNEPGPQLKTPGLLSYPEICNEISTTNSSRLRNAHKPLRRVPDLFDKYGIYALRPANEQGEHGVWVSYDDPEFAGLKSCYARGKGLGGVAVFDLSLDDFNGRCVQQAYPILRSIKACQ